MSQVIKNKQVRARDNSGPDPVSGESALPIWHVEGHGCPRETIEAPTQEMAAYFYRDRYGISQLRSDNDLKISLVE